MWELESRSGDADRGFVDQDLGVGDRGLGTCFVRTPPELIVHGMQKKRIRPVLNSGGCMGRYETIVEPVMHVRSSMVVMPRTMALFEVYGLGLGIECVLGLGFIIRGSCFGAGVSLGVSYSMHASGNITTKTQN